MIYIMVGENQSLSNTIAFQFLLLPQAFIMEFNAMKALKPIKIKKVKFDYFDPNVTLIVLKNPQPESQCQILMVVSFLN